MESSFPAFEIRYSIFCGSAVFRPRLQRGSLFKMKFHKKTLRIYFNVNYMLTIA